MTFLLRQQQQQAYFAEWAVEKNFNVWGYSIAMDLHNINKNGISRTKEITFSNYILQSIYFQHLVVKDTKKDIMV